jgi:hypothetical protein
MLPALRRSLHGFTRRADILLRPDQLRLLNSERKRRVATRAEMAGPDDPIGRRRLFVEEGLASSKVL